jgi:hypothetical protein
LIPGIVTAGVVILIALLPGMQAAWQTNLAAVQIARIQLTGWPNAPWYDPDFVNQVQPAQEHLHRALEQQSGHAAALYHLGLIALEGRDFALAETYLSQAHAFSPGHLGIRKSLGYAQLWLGNLAAARALLADRPEMIQELDYYAWWWETQERTDLAANAANLRRQLRE